MESNLLKKLDYNNLILTSIVTVLVLTTNMKINKNYKLIFLLFAVLICIYDLNYLIPFVTTFLILTLYNIGKKEKKEFFRTSMYNLKEKRTDYENAQVRTLRENFKSNLSKVPFFSDLNDDQLNNIYFELIELKLTPADRSNLMDDANIKTKARNILKRINAKPEDLYDLLEFSNINELNRERTNIINSLDEPSGLRLKLGLIFEFSPRREFYNFILKISRQLGFINIINDELSPERPNNPTDFMVRNYQESQNEYDKLKINLKEAIINLFSNNVDDNDINSVIDFDINTETGNPKNIDLFSYNFDIESYIDEKNYKHGTTGNDIFFIKIKNILDYDFSVFKNNFLVINYEDDSERKNISNKLNIYYGTFLSAEDINDGYTDKKLIISGNFKEFLEENESLISGTITSKVQTILSNYKRQIDNVVRNLNLFTDIIRPIRNREEKNKTNLKLHYNLYSLIFLTNRNFRTDFYEEIEIESINNNISSLFTNYKNTIQDIIGNEDIPNFSTLGLNVTHIYNNSLFGIFKKDEKLFTLDLFIPEIFLEEREEDAEDEEEEEISIEDNPRWYEDSELNKFFETSKISDEKEAQLEKYYQAMNFKNEGLKEISKQAKIYADMEKAKNISFDNKVNNISTSIFEVIDKIKEAIQTTAEDGVSEGETNIEFYLKFSKKIGAIITDDEHILSMGLVFILISFFLYFVDSTKSGNKDISIIDLIKEVKISI